MKRTSVLFVLAEAVALALVVGVAFAATVECHVGVVCAGTDAPEELLGTDEARSDPQAGRRRALWF